MTVQQIGVEILQSGPKWLTDTASMAETLQSLCNNTNIAFAWSGSLTLPITTWLSRK